MPWHYYYLVFRTFWNIVGLQVRFTFMLVCLEKKIRHAWCLLKSTDHVFCLKIYLRNIAFMYRITSKEFSSRSILISSCLVSNCWNNCMCGSCLKYVGCVHFWERKVMTIVKVMHHIRHLPEFSGMYLQY